MQALEVHVEFALSNDGGGGFPSGLQRPPPLITITPLQAFVWEITGRGSESLEVVIKKCV